MDGLEHTVLEEPKKKRMLPNIRTDLQLYPIKESVSGKPGYILFDPVSDGYFRLTRKNYEILSRFYDGQDLDNLLVQLDRINIKTTEQEIFQMLNFLRGSGLLYPTPGATEKELKVKAVNHRKAFVKSLTKRYMFFKIPLVDPDNFLKDTVPFVKIFFKK